MLSKPILEFIHQNDVEKTAAIIKQQMEQDKDVIQFENRYRTKKGSFRWFEWSAKPVIEEGITYSAAYDITDRKRAEEDLRESEGRYRDLIENAVVGIYQVTKEGQYVVAVLLYFPLYGRNINRGHHWFLARDWLSTVERWLTSQVEISYRIAQNWVNLVRG